MRAGKPESLGKAPREQHLPWAVPVMPSWGIGGGREEGPGCAMAPPAPGLSSHLPNLPHPCFAGAEAALAGAKGTVSFTSATAGLSCCQSKLNYLIPRLCPSPVGRFTEMSHHCVTAKPGQLAGRSLCCGARELLWLAPIPGASLQLGIKQARAHGGLGTGWLCPWASAPGGESL